MQGRQILEQPLFSTIDISEFVPKTHLLRKIDRVLDLSFLRKYTSQLYSSDTGRPSIDPETFTRMQLIGYLYGINSDRRLCEECHLNIAYRWFLRIPLENKVPSHSSMTRIRDRFGEDVFKCIFENIVDQCKNAGLANGKKLIVDASIFQANASMDSLVERDSESENRKALKPHQEQYHDFKYGKTTRKYSNQTHVSSTDPDSTFVSTKTRRSKLSYKAHYTIDARKRIIIDCYITTGSKHEAQVLPERIDELISNFKFKPIEVIADRGYGRGPTYSKLRKMGIRAYIPLHDPRPSASDIAKQDFEYDQRNDRYKCPQGNYLLPYEKTDRGIKRYRIVGGLCRTCSLKESCLPEKQKHRARFLFRNPLQGEIDSVRRRMPTNTFIKKQIERKWKIEGMFAEAKDRHCLRRAKYRGRSKVQIQLYLTAIVQNLKRMSKSSQYWRNSLNFRCVLWSKSDLDQKAINQVQIFAFIVNLILNLRTRLFFNRPMKLIHFLLPP